MIKIEELSYSVPAKGLFKDVSFSLEAGSHAALIGGNGTGKSTLADMIIHSEDYLFDGKIEKDPACRIGYVQEFSSIDKAEDETVNEYLREKFIENEENIAMACEEMAEGENLEAAFEKYQYFLDLNEAMGGDNYESNIGKSLHQAGLTHLKDRRLSEISGGEYKLVQIMREMLLAPNVLILDEPDVFLDFANLNGLCSLLNSYKGVLLVITQNRYLLNHAFNQILNLENGTINSFHGTYSEYRVHLLAEKLKLKEKSLKEEEEIERTQELVDTLRRRATILTNPAIGRSVNAKQSQLDRMRDRHEEMPEIDSNQPKIRLPELEDTREGKVLSVENYQVAFDKDILENVSFEIKAGEKVALVGANGTGKTTLIHDIMKGSHPAIKIPEGTAVSFLSQIRGEGISEEKTVYQVMSDAGFPVLSEAKEYLSKYFFEEGTLNEKVSQLSAGEQNLLQLALIGASQAELLVLDEPTSHLDIFAQGALETAIANYKGAILMVSHDFYFISNTADYVLLAWDGSVRRTSVRKFRKMVYDNYFKQEYLETDKKKQDLEAAFTMSFKEGNLEACKKALTGLEEIEKY